MEYFQVQTFLDCVISREIKRFFLYEMIRNKLCLYLHTLVANFHLFIQTRKKILHSIFSFFLYPSIQSNPIHSKGACMGISRTTPLYSYRVVSSQMIQSVRDQVLNALGIPFVYKTTSPYETLLLQS